MLYLQTTLLVLFQDAILAILCINFCSGGTLPLNRKAADWATVFLQGLAVGKAKFQFDCVGFFGIYEPSSIAAMQPNSGIFDRTSRSVGTRTQPKNV